jgi:hypothetical protein
MQELSTSAFGLPRVRCFFEIKSPSEGRKKPHLAMAELLSSVIFNTTPSASTGPTFKVRAIPGNWTPSITGRDFLRYSETIQKF